MGLERYFKKMDPVDFLKQYPLRVDIVTKAQVLGKSLMRKKGVLLERTDESRIVYGVIEPASNSYKNPHQFGPLRGYDYIGESGFKSKFGFKQLHLCKIHAEKPLGKQQSFPLFYVDWAMNKTYKTKLESSKDSANFFLTAEISGCSIFIEGDPKKPDIYHSNANQEQLRVDVSKMSKDDVTSAKFDLKASKMAKEVKQSKHDKIHYGRAPAKGRYIKGTDYLDNIGGAKKQAVKAFSSHSKKVSGIDPKFARKKTYQRLGTEGTVFGLRDTKTFKWKFYVQKRVWGIIEFKYPGIIRGVLKTIHGEKWLKAREELYFYEYPTQVAEIWPGGSLSHAYIHI